MPGVYKRKSDRARGAAGRWTCWWVDESGKKREKAGTTDKARSLEIARTLDAEARQVRAGLVEPGMRLRREAASRPIGDHVDDYRKHLVAKGDTPGYVRNVTSALRRLFADAEITSISDFSGDRLHLAFGRLRARRSARTANDWINAVKAFAHWLEAMDRIQEVPRGVRGLKPYNEAVDRRLIRRALTKDECERLIAAAEAGETILVHSLVNRNRSERRAAPLDGPQRAMIYRLALGTGFRAGEIRALVPESFRLEGKAPFVVVEAKTAKNRRRTDQPIARKLAAALRPWVEKAAPGTPVFFVPRTFVDFIRADLKAAGIPAKTAEGSVDFHALRHTYITHLVQSGASVATAQRLARHSTPTLTLGRYTHVGADDFRRALGDDDDE